jgi:hypothetical protein
MLRRPEHSTVEVVAPKEKKKKVSLPSTPRSSKYSLSFKIRTENQYFYPFLICLI